MSKTNQKKQVIQPLTTVSGVQMRKVRRNGVVSFEPIGNGYTTALVDGRLNTIKKGGAS